MRRRRPRAGIDKASKPAPRAQALAVAGWPSAKQPARVARHTTATTRPSNVSRERVRQMEQEALRKLHHMMAREFGEEPREFQPPMRRKRKSG